MNEVFSAALAGGVLGTFLGGFSKFLWERAGCPTGSRGDARSGWSASNRRPTFGLLPFVALADLQGRLRAIAQTQAANAEYTKAIGETNYYLHSTAFLIGRAFAALQVLRVRMASFDYADLYRKLETYVGLLRRRALVPVLPARTTRDRGAHARRGRSLRLHLHGTVGVPRSHRAARQSAVDGHHVHPGRASPTLLAELGRGSDR